MPTVHPAESLGTETKQPCAFGVFLTPALGGQGPPWGPGPAGRGTKLALLVPVPGFRSWRTR